MKIEFEILRRESSQAKARLQKIIYNTEDMTETVATALNNINESGEYHDTDGDIVSKIRWECSCLQKKCGACAMLINGRARLACDSFLKEYVNRKTKEGRIRLEPLKKFPVVADLIADRSIMFDNLRTLKVWLDEEVNVQEKAIDNAYEASRCLQCGCCLEVCPNFYPEGDFVSAAGFVPNARLLSELSEDGRDKVRALYKEHVYDGCAKSLACQKVCPAGIDMDHILSRSNAISIWRRK